MAKAELADRFDSENRKLGLALSGGGFRASLFHIGVLARLAEFGLLPSIEVISMVSGGAILGAAYYLHLKRLLEAKEDAQISEADYLEIVGAMEKDFLAAVQKNIRMRTFANPVKNLKMMFAHYSRSDRIGEIYDELLYRPILDSRRKTPIEMRELLIRPKGDRDDFHPRNHNKSRRAKVPILIINATTVNTGHNWRFEAARMGEPPRSSEIARELDKNMRLRRPPSYNDITPRQQNIELGLAVAASAGVPGLFPPLAITGLYDRDIRVQLIDGGVHDNQGIAGLLEEKCTDYVVSDASGQMADEIQPPSGLLSVLLRANDIGMDRIREEELFALNGARVRKVALMHLRKGLSAEAIPWIDQNGKPAMAKREREPDISSSQFGVDPGVQDLLSNVRTDLDAFTDIEAHSLMLDGYLMSEPVLRETYSLPQPPPSVPWGFLDIDRWISQPTPDYLNHLEIAKKRLFKVFRLSLALTGFTLLTVGFILWGLWVWQEDRISAWLNSTVSIKQLMIAIVIFALGFIPWASRSFKLLRFLRSPAEFITRLVVRALVPFLGAVFIWIHLLIYDRIFLVLGRVERLKK